MFHPLVKGYWDDGAPNAIIHESSSLPTNRYGIFFFFQKPSFMHKLSFVAVGF
ncbi:hypothetical protein GLYMA_12G085300v4 [Glycine max]|uniref:Uncharacterized protein n=1 Tax=Glycine max TaxID=3847 RepID=K7LTR6_SOYBN|nr:hypothetical protein GYH30_033105 [Glycine max]KRH25166.1 hypothetical protein GLYMA_12G085300v4 [Glycine max]